MLSAIYYSVGSRSLCCSLRRAERLGRRSYQFICAGGARFGFRRMSPDPLTSFGVFRSLAIFLSWAIRGGISPPVMWGWHKSQSVRSPMAPAGE